MTVSERHVIAAACLAGILLGAATFPEGRDNLLFHLNRPGIDSESQAVAETIRFFSGTLAGFYVTGGKVAGLNMFPADHLVKRRVFQDLRMIRDRRMILAMDKESQVIQSVELLDRTHAVAVTDEQWILEFQEGDSRRSLAKGLNAIAARYFLKKNWGKWQVMDYEVFSPDDRMPPLEKDKIARM